MADLRPYLTDEELAEYVPGYLEEGAFSGEGTLKIFPIAKSVELLMLNATDWEKFAAATGADDSAFATVEGITETARQYYEWTDAQTPDIPDDGKAFFGRDAFANYMIIGARQLGVELLRVELSLIHIYGTVPAYSECMRAATGMPSDGSAFGPIQCRFSVSVQCRVVGEQLLGQTSQPRVSGAAQRRVRSDERQRLLLGCIQCTAVGHQAVSYTHLWTAAKQTGRRPLR